MANGRTTTHSKVTRTYIIFQNRPMLRPPQLSTHPWAHPMLMLLLATSRGRARTQDSASRRPKIFGEELRREEMRAGGMVVGDGWKMGALQLENGAMYKHVEVENEHRTHHDVE